ncbi:MAG: twin-arginine translocase TatA/TatE family subunit [Chloroflexota bacterium]|nr:twin-arginine translocase TatA/TatE family subunit [Chloroflexota bacterium]
MEILNVGLGEMLIIFIIALLVFGPERLPEIARQAARILAQIRGATDEIQRAFMSETSYFKETFEETRREIEATAKPITEVKKEIEATATPLKESKQELAANLEAVKQPFKSVSRSSLDEDGSVAQEKIADKGAPREPVAYKPVSRSEGPNDDA